ncbi:hypothetical protein V5096_01520 [Pseudoalteromonas carrageenovora]|uniref:KfrA N-terminal DNA-binding domain-containing protein n=1 Tax=Pseudoalteromonas tetraodonis TaxID=43659 RepID=A0ABD4ER08_9GAMM|nr:hypothetical protein [Pseudoalteromonas spiralis]KYL35243.1 hypothetical protein A2I96_01430 [Pseudoalteromonas spiralis]
MTKSLEPFRNAILNSLNLLVESGDKITAASVIKNAKFEDGRAVGKSTLYRKNNVSKKYIHEDLILLIDETKNDFKKARGKPTKNESIDSYKKKIEKLKRQLDDMVDQLAEQESRLRRASSGVTSNSQSISSLEGELYILYSILFEITSEQTKINKKANNFINKYEIKSTSIDSIRSAKSSVKGYIDDIQNSTLVRL